MTWEHYVADLGMLCENQNDCAVMAVMVAMRRRQPSMASTYLEEATMIPARKPRTTNRHLLLLCMCSTILHVKPYLSFTLGAGTHTVTPLAGSRRLLERSIFSPLIWRAVARRFPSTMHGISDQTPQITRKACLHDLKAGESQVQRHEDPNAGIVLFQCTLEISAIRWHVKSSRALHGSPRSCH